MRRAHSSFAAVGLIGLALSCRRSAETPSATGTQLVAASASASSSAPPHVQDTCTRDDECAVARVEVSGPRACCAACGTTPGTRSWHAELQRWCGVHVPSTCPALACPMGPTRAVCRSGHCAAIATDDAGAPTIVLDERRCLPAIVCDTWSDCATVVGNAQDGWFVEHASAAPRGTLASIANVCTTGAKCEAAKLFLPETVCPPWTAPPLIEPPKYACALDGGVCRATAKP